MSNEDQDWKTRLKDAGGRVLTLLEKTIVDLSCLEVNSVLVSNISADHPLDDRKFLQEIYQELTDWFENNQKMVNSVQQTIDDVVLSQLKNLWDEGKCRECDDNVKSQLSNAIKACLNQYLFSWDNVPGKDSKRLLRSIRDFFYIDGAENAEISKSDDDKTIHISKDKNSAEINIDDKKEKATLKTSDDIIHDLKVKRENGKLNIYLKHNQDELSEEQRRNRSEYRRRLRYLHKYLELHCSKEWVGVMLKDRDHQQLRKLWELVDTKYIYAQTVLDLDGDIMSRVNNQLFNEGDGKAEELMRFHKWNVEGGVNYRNGLMNTFVQIIKTLIGR